MTKTSAKNQRYNVVFNKEIGKWQIKKTDALRAVENFSTKEEALKRARALSKHQDTAFVIKNKDGKFGKK
jgi:uncharacterized protein YdaT